MILLANADTKTANLITERARRRAATTKVRLNQSEIQFSVSAGIAVVREGDSPQCILKRADLALYDAKRLGRDQVKLNLDQVVVNPATSS